MLKRFAVQLFCFLFSILIFITPAYAENAITVTIDGNALAFDVPPQLIGGRTMVPMRIIFEALGASVE
jgi:hypothetical protein